MRPAELAVPAEAQWEGKSTASTGFPPTALPASNHEEASDQPRLRDLQNKLLVLLRNARVLKKKKKRPRNLFIQLETQEMTLGAPFVAQWVKDLALLQL